MLALPPGYTAVACTKCGEVHHLAPHSIDEHGRPVLATLPENQWSLVTDRLCDDCWFSEYL